MRARTVKALIITICLVAYAGTGRAQAVFPIAQGRVVFHRYTSFDNYDGQLYIFDFASRTITTISAPWNIDNATNAHFSPDGSKIVFMGVPKGQHTSASWDIYLWNTGGASPPVDLTEGNGVLDQDPKFFPDGKHVTFKHAGDIAVIDIDTKELRTLTSDGDFATKSMEYPTADGSKILFVQGSGASSSIYLLDTTSKAVTPLITGSFQNYYPIVRDDTTFLYARWATATNKADDIYISDFAGNSRPAAFDTPAADDSDPFPVDSVLVLFSSDRPGTTGGYDLYVGNLTTGQARSLNLFGVVNTSLHELGACYTPFAAPTSVGSTPAPEVSRSALLQVYPNPCNPTTVVSCQLPVVSRVTLAVYDLLGREVATLADGVQSPGAHSFTWDGGHCSSGIYVCRLQSDLYSVALRIVLLR